MTLRQGPAHDAYVREMFGRIAPRYDLLNRLMTFGRDRSWRGEAVRRLRLPARGQLLDVGTGTGDLALEARRRSAGLQIAAADFSPVMLRHAARRRGAAGVNWLVADAARLPFAARSFDAVVSGFLLRNLSDLDGALTEMRRVLRPGGRLASLDTTPPPPGPLRPLIEFHLRRVIPTLGRLIAGDAEAYNYLPASTSRFLPPDDLAVRIRAAGFRQIEYVRRMLGTIAIHWAEADQNAGAPQAGVPAADRR